MEKVLLSIIIPTYKRSENIEKAINSVLRQAGSFELIVVDDNDEDSIFRKHNEEIMQKYLNNYNNFYYLKHKKNMNGATARNTGIKFCHGQYITFLDDDDEFIKDRIMYLEKNIKFQKSDFICTGYSIYRKNKFIKSIIPNVDCEIKKLQFDILCQESFFGTGSNIVCKAELIKKIIGFDESFIRHQDMEFMLRYLDECKTICCIKQNLVIKNVDDSSNLPDYQKMLGIKKKFINKFDYIINRYDEKDRKKIYKMNYYQLLNIAYKKGNKDDINDCIKLLKDNNIYNKGTVIKTKLMEIVKKNEIIQSLRHIIKK